MNTLLIRFGFGASPPSERAKRHSTYTPNRSRIPETTGSAASAESDESTTAPTKAPMNPGPASSPTIRQSTLPKRQ